MLASRSRFHTGTLVMPKISSDPVSGSGTASRQRGSSGTPVCLPIASSIPTTWRAAPNAASVSP